MRSEEVKQLKGHSRTVERILTSKNITLEEYKAQRKDRKKKEKEVKKTKHLRALSKRGAKKSKALAPKEKKAKK